MNPTEDLAVELITLIEAYYPEIQPCGGCDENEPSRMRSQLKSRVMAKLSEYRANQAADVLTLGALVEALVWKRSNCVCLNGKYETEALQHAEAIKADSDKVWEVIRAALKARPTPYYLGEWGLLYDALDALPPHVVEYVKGVGE